MRRSVISLIVCSVWSVSTLHAQNADYTPFRNPKYAHLYQVDTIAVDGISYERIVDKRETGPLILFLSNKAKNLGDVAYRLNDCSSPPQKDE